MTAKTGPFRADHVGSMLRPAALKAAKEKRDNGQLSDQQFKEIEDREVVRIIRMQEDVGLKLATDGELRRRWWNYDFFDGIEGVEGYDGTDGIAFQGVTTPPRKIRITSKLGSGRHPMLEHFSFLKANTKVTPKMTIPSPSVMHFRPGNQSVDRSVYPDLDQYFEDLALAYQGIIADFYKAGCRYLQFDDTTWAFLCSKDQRQLVTNRGEDPAKMEEIYAKLINRSLENRPADMTITTHICRGNFRSTWISEGGYEPVAERVFGTLDFDGFFLEFDDARSGGFEPIRFVPRGNKRVVLGIVTSKTAALEPKDGLKRRIDEASKYLPLEQLCISPQCGFASTSEGNDLTEAEQIAKLGLVVDVAREVWGQA